MASVVWAQAAWPSRKASCLVACMNAHGWFLHHSLLSACSSHPALQPALRRPGPTEALDSYVFHAPGWEARLALREPASTAGAGQNTHKSQAERLPISLPSRLLDLEPVGNATTSQLPSSTRLLACLRLSPHGHGPHVRRKKIPHRRAANRLLCSPAPDGQRVETR